MIMRLLYAIRAALPEPDDDDPRLDRRLADEPDVLAPLNEAMLTKLSEVDPREATDQAIHVVICGMRYEFIGSAMHAVYNAVRAQIAQSKSNARQLGIVRAQASLMLVGMFVIAVIELFGRDKGVEILTKISHAMFGG